jgi:hypothetical protein
VPTLAQSFVQAMLQIGRDSGGLGVRNRFVISRCAARREDIAARSNTIVTLPGLLLTVFAERQIRSHRSQCRALMGSAERPLLFERSYKTAQPAFRTAGSPASDMPRILRVPGHISICQIPYIWYYSVV